MPILWRRAIHFHKQIGMADAGDYVDTWFASRNLEFSKFPYKFYQLASEHGS